MWEYDKKYSYWQITLIVYKKRVELHKTSITLIDMSSKNISYVKGISCKGGHNHEQMVGNLLYQQILVMDKLPNFRLNRL